jgi:DNA-binding NarL/FixJ family response regulator
MSDLREHDSKHQEEAAPLRLLLVDDQRLFLDGLTYVLESRASDMVVVGTALDGAEAVELARELQPELILMDVRMPGMDGVEAARIIHNELPTTRIVMLTTFADDEYVKAALAHGAIGYLLKNRPPIELINSIRAVRAGIMQIDPTVSRVLLNRTQGREDRDEEIGDAIRTLTRREKEVLHLMVQAFDNQQIADTLHVAEQTVRNYISTIYSKLGLSNRMDIIRIMKKLSFYLDRDV